MATSIESNCEIIKQNYSSCLNKSGRNPSKCKSIESQLRECSKSTGINYCVDEIINLLQCSNKPKSDMCAKEFVSMRECNRPEGPQIIIEDEKYKIVKDKSHLFKQDNLTISSTEAPIRSYSSLKNTVNSLRSMLGLANIEKPVVAYKWGG